MKKFYFILFFVSLFFYTTAFCNQNNIFGTYIGKSRGIVKLLQPNAVETEDGYYIIDSNTSSNGSTLNILLSFDENDVVESVWVIAEDSGTFIVIGNDAYAGLSAGMQILGIGTKNISDVVEEDGNIFATTNDSIVCVTPSETTETDQGKTRYIIRCSQKNEIDSEAQYLKHYYEASSNSLLVTEFSISNITNRQIIYSNTRFAVKDSLGNQLQMDTSSCSDSTKNQYLNPHQSINAKICWKDASNPPFYIYYVNFIPESYKTGDSGLSAKYLYTIK